MVLKNFLFDVCKCEGDWSLLEQIPKLEAEIRETARGRKVCDPSAVYRRPRR